MLSKQKMRKKVDRLLAEVAAEHKSIKHDITCLEHSAGCTIFIVLGVDHMHTLHMQLCESVGDVTRAMIAHELSVCPTRSVALAELLDMTYSPELLLDGHFDVSMMEDAEFPDACGWGFTAFLEQVENGDGGPFTRSEVQERVREDMREVQLPLVWRVGFVLGWLSALAFVQRTEALAGLKELLALVDQL